MKRILLLPLAVLLLFSSCSGKDNTSKNNTGNADTGEINRSSEPVKLRIGLMPAVDTAPIFLAEERGYFDVLGLDVELILFTNAQDRQSALQSGAIDGAMTDLVAVAVNVSGGFDIRATTLTDGMFPLVAVPGASEKVALKVGMMEISVSNFLVDQWIGSKYEIEKVYINSIPARLEAVASGQLDMGLFPEPVATVGTLKGLEMLVFDPVDGFSPDVMVFTGKALRTKAEGVRLFHEGFNKAVRDIQESESLAREILVASIPNIKAELKDKMILPAYHEARLPDEQYLNKIIQWTNTIVDQELTVTAEQMVDRSFISQ
ncbi:MAG: ABC transporter substrate-binding protein [Spirochaetales bacterium]|nr:ABC transporter substrate-binding protein [Spirochaetales bacterium]